VDAVTAGPRTRSHVDARCPVRVGEPCTLCFPGATGPKDCGLVHLVMDDDELRSALADQRAAHRDRSTD
jgi:hypothetical protein